MVSRNFEEGEATRAPVCLGVVLMTAGFNVVFGASFLEPKKYPSVVKERARNTNRRAKKRYL